MTASVTPASHLYAGFRYAGALASIQAQRDFQRQILVAIPGEDLFIVGCAYGQEAQHLISGTSRWTKIVAIDLADVGPYLVHQPALSARNSGMRWFNCDLLDSSRLPGYGAFDAVQCGFVLHDIPPTAKERAMFCLAEAVHSEGYVIISDIFIRSENDRSSSAEVVYDAFLHEASTALRSNRLNYSQWHELVGDGVAPGLLRSRQDALEGYRDHFESIDYMMARAARVGLNLEHVFSNPVNEHLHVLVFRHAALKP